jgi:hypothetical protein
MRNTLFALVLTFPLAALAQTPRDIAAQLWLNGAPAHAGHAPAQAAFGAFTAHDVAEQLWPEGAPASRNSAPVSGTAMATGMTGADLARLLSGSALSGAPDQPVRIVRDDRPHG